MDREWSSKERASRQCEPMATLKYARGRRGGRNWLRRSQERQRFAGNVSLPIRQLVHRPRFFSFFFWLFVFSLNICRFVGFQVCILHRSRRLRVIFCQIKVAFAFVIPAAFVFFFFTSERTTLYTFCFLSPVSLFFLHMFSLLMPKFVLVY